MEERRQSGLNMVDPKKWWIKGWRRKLFGKAVLRFWIDVYCIPHGGLKRAAIAQMTPIYSGAEQVLMLDQTLFQADYLTKTDIQARIIRSPWMGRYWTLQESALATALLYQLPDGIHEDQYRTSDEDTTQILSLSDSLRHNMPTNDHDRTKYDFDVMTRHNAVGKAFLATSKKNGFRKLEVLEWPFRSYYYFGFSTLLVSACKTTMYKVFGDKYASWEYDFVADLYVHRLQTDSGSTRIKRLRGFIETIMDRQLSDRDIQLVMVWNTLLGRSTTKEEDIHTILANMLDFHATQVQGFERNERFKAMLCAYDRVPLEIIFSQACADMSTSTADKDRWVPPYPAGLALDPIESNLGFAEPRIGKGLSLCLEGGKTNVAVYWLPVNTRRLVSFRIQFDEDQFWVQLHNTSEFRTLSNQVVQRCLLLEDRWLKRGGKSPRDELVPLSGYMGTGAMLVHAEQEGTTITAIFDSPISWGTWDPSMSDRHPVVPCYRLPGRLMITLETGKSQF